MDKQPDEGYNSSTQGNRTGDGEALDLRLTLEQASSLILILTDYNERANQRVKTVNEMIISYRKDGNDFWVDKLSKGLEIDMAIMDDANLLYKEISEIMVELEKPKKVIIKPSWRE